MRNKEEQVGDIVSPTIKRLNWDLEKEVGNWAKYLKPIMESEEMYDLYQEFKECKETITPASKDLFKWLRVCPPENLKIIALGMDSYPSRYRTGSKELQATGIALDCSNSPDGKVQPSMAAFYDGISEEYKEKFVHSPDISYLCEQGVMLSNRALNCKLNKSGSMIPKWDFFWKYFLEEVITPYFTGVQIVLLGKDAAVLKKFVFEMSNPLYILTHPSFAARTYSIWETNNTFHKLNKYLKEANGADYQIIWGKEQYLEQKLPF